MKKSSQHITFKVLLWAFFIPLILLNLSHSFGQDRCATQLILKERNAGQEQKQQQRFENWLIQRQTIAKILRQKETKEIVQIPVVFHILHKGESVGNGLNISKARIDRQLVTLNEDFNQQNADGSSTLSAFASFAANIEIEFVYAKQTPDGYPTNGIVRQVANQNNYTYQERETLATESFWPPEDYLNIWVTDIRAPSLGWAEFPSTTLSGIDEGSIKSNADGIAIDYQYLGDNPNSPTFESKGRTLTHEMGHFFGLRHIWGDGGCNADDFCEDTPPSSESTSGCDLTKNTCGSLDMVQNFMDYTNDACMSLFTQDQKIRMRTVLENSPRRVSLINSIALNEAPVFAHDAGILSVKPTAYRSSCANNYIPSILVRNLGTDSLDKYSVKLYTSNKLLETIEILDSPLAPGDEALVIFSELDTEEILNNTLRYKVTIIGFADERTENNETIEYIQKLNNQNLPYSIDFTSSLENWFIRNPDNEEGWEKTSEGVYLATFKNRANMGETDALISPILDFTTIDIPELNLVYAQSDDSIQNRFSIYASYDCGKSFQDLVYSSASEDLVTAYTTEQSFTPKYRLDWDTLNIDLARMRDQASVCFKIEVENRGANNFYINTVSITESKIIDRQLTPVGWNNLNPLFCDQPISGELIVKNTGRNAVTSFKLKIRDGNKNLIEKIYNTVVLSKQSISLALQNLMPEKDKGALTTTIETSFEGKTSIQTIELPYTYNCDEELPPARLDLAENSENNLFVFNPDKDKSWQYDTQLNMLSSYSSDIKADPSEDWLISPIIDVSNIDYISLIFDVAYQKPFKQEEGLFIILQPIDTAETEKVIYAKMGDSLATSFGNNPDPIAITRNELIDLSPYLFHEKFRLIFKATHQNGANIYINDISLFLGQDLPPDFPQTQKPFVIYPNPVKNGILNLHFNLPLAEAGTITVTDSHGRIIRQFTQPKILNQFVQFNFSDLSTGLYLLHFNSPTIQRTAKFIID